MLTTAEFSKIMIAITENDVPIVSVPRLKDPITFRYLIEINRREYAKAKACLPKF